MANYTSKDAKKMALFAPLGIGRNKTIASRSFPASISIPSIDNIKGVVVTKDNNNTYYTMEDWETMGISKRKELEEYAEYTNFTIRYIYGQNSIFADKQKISDEEAKNKLTSIMMFDGVLAVNVDEIPKIKYLRACNYNRDNPHRLSTASPLFSETDLEKSAREENKKIMNEADAIGKVSNMNTLELEMLALSLSATVPQFKRYATMDGQTLKREMFVMMKRRPELIDIIIKDEDMKVKAVVAKGFAENIWEFDGKTGLVSWTESKNPVTTVRSSDDLIPSLVEFIKKDSAMNQKFLELSEKLGKHFDPLYAVNKKKVTPQEEEKDKARSAFIEKHGVLGGVVLDYIDKGLLSISIEGNPAASRYTLEFDEGDKKRTYHGINKMKAALTQEGILEELEKFDGTLQHA